MGEKALRWFSGSTFPDSEDFPSKEKDLLDERLIQRLPFAAGMIRFRDADHRAVASTYATSSGPDGFGGSDLT
ncbi:MAG: hypothetical protein LV481_08175 [Methylacidiphilales bacterium]|nr:hypothetical protein [Candidatus Methylacidiphilales bacterium]